MEKTYPPFSCTHSNNLPELLNSLNITIAISTYQAGKVIFLSPKNNDVLIQLPRTFNKAMGMCFEKERFALATKEEVIVFANHPGLGHSYPNKPGVYDNFFVPRATYYTGQVDIHDLEWGKDGLWAINTSFSCLCKIDESFSFIPVWKPDFITELVSEDRCHLNGMALVNGNPKYITSLGHKNSLQSWRENITEGGLLFDVENNKIILDKLPMPHSPVWYKEKLYFLLSASGEIMCFDPKTNETKVIKVLKGFIRGMDIYQDYMFIGLSKLRQNSSTFKQLPVAELASEAGIAIVHLPTGSLVAELFYKTSVDEIYSVKILPEMKRPGILNTIDQTFRLGLSIPVSDFWAKNK